MRYVVKWEIEFEDSDVTDAADAARKALAIQRDPDSIAQFFIVEDNQENRVYEVDLWPVLKVSSTERVKA